MLGVRQGKLPHRPLLEAYRPGEEQNALGGGERRGIGNDALAGRQRIAQPARQVPVEVFGPSPEDEDLFRERDSANEERWHEHEDGPHRRVVPR